MTGALAAIAVADAGLLLSARALPGGAVAALHLFATAAALLLWLRHGRLAALPAIVGLLGPAALLAGIRLAGRERAAQDRTMLPARPVTLRRRSIAARLLDGRVRHSAPDNLGSLVAVMRHGDVPTRRRALETVVRSFEPALSPLIALALTDRDQTIRALAAAAAARVAANFTTAREALERRCAGGEPDAPAALAALLGEQARANVLFSDQQRATMRHDALAIAGDDPSLHAAAAWAAGDYDALDRLVAGVARGGRDPLAHLRDWWRAEPA